MEAADIVTGKQCVIADSSSDVAPKMIGDQITYRSYGFNTGSPELSGWRAIVTGNTSSDKPGENPGRRKPKVSWARFVLPVTIIAG